MNQKVYSKLEYPIDITTKMLHFAGKLLQEHENFKWVPDWLVRTLGINGCAVGVILAQHCIVHFNSQDQSSQADTTEIDVDVLWCSQQDPSGNMNLPCHVFDCPVRRKVVERYGRADCEVTCFPMAGKKGFLMACGEGLQVNSFSVIEILKALTQLVECSLNIEQDVGKAASFFLPSENVAQMWSEMLAGLSHDLRTPLACIKGYVTTLLREDVNWEPEDRNDFLQIIVEETDHIEDLINNLLDASTLSWKGDIELKKEPILLPHIVNKVLRDQSFHSKNHQFTVLFPRDFPFVNADQMRIEQVLRNLVDNAVKYSTENTEIVIKGELLSGEVIVSVADQGIGIGDEHLNRLFEKFFRVSNGIQEHQKGMGLGLPLARQILISHGGRIWATSKLNHGSTFYFTLPVGTETK
ncbi:MAG: Alkaline phosphatase synthesis sensor protein PhoR [Pelotomaculum sp. PtaB.Bin104]|nr:MAG: Alkaline phosphatase synthesis sensor protein PhoR [Pelotomaculum sp. PtaB.Bin104]